ncbi:MAG TPA: GAF domain-containing protein [Pseudomonadales bacterium]|nr:GAF domain-containing protein [Pseudomonadales bacterium]
MNAPLPKDEADRLDELAAYQILDTLPEREYDDLTNLAERLLDAPIVLISLVDRERQWFKSCIGTDLVETPRDQSFCAWAILEPTQVMVVEDAAVDDRFSDMMTVAKEPYIRFYAGAPLVNRAGRPLGTLCVLDTRPRTLTDDQVEVLATLARQVTSQLELRRLVSELEYEREQLRASNADLERVQRQLGKLLERVKVRGQD